jgi:hypothetical protein
MALSTCRDCGREVSTLARHCVHCGRPRPTGTTAGSVVGTIVAVVLAIAITGAMICAAKRACRKIHSKTGWECRAPEARQVETQAQPPAPQEDRK